jgi:ferredoxin
MNAGTEPQSLRIDWPRCRGRGLCAELLPELLQLDEWGYPIVTAEVPDPLIAQARVALSACPHQALRLVRRAVSLRP